MSPSAHLVRREGARGVKWHVRFRWRPTDSKAKHFMSVDKKSDAEIVRAWVMTEIANGRYPTVERYLAEGEPVRKPTLFEVHDAWVEDRKREVGESAVKQARQARATYGRLGELAADEITVEDCRRWVRELDSEDEEKRKRPGTISAYRSVLRGALDFADLDHPNPARDPRVKLPRRSDEDEDDLAADPPSYVHFTAMLAEIAPKHSDALLVLERTGFRISDLIRLTWGDVDWADDLLRVRRGKTIASRRWVPMLEEVRALLEARPADERVAKAQVFPGITNNSMRSAMYLACEKAGIPTYTPHDLRHRYTSLLVMGGVPAPLVGRIVGHKRVSVTLETYAHVLMDEPRNRMARLVAAAWTVPGAAQAPRTAGAYAVPSPSPEEA